jgi:rod shape-determining protein MreC
MESFLNRYRNITVLLLVIFAQLILLAVQVKNDQDVRVIRVWTVTAITPVARVIEAVRGGTVGFVQNYFTLHNADAENRKLRDEVGRLKIENIFLKDQLNLADRAKALQLFQAKTPSKMVAATVIGTGAGAGSKIVLVDTGSSAGVERGMAVVTPDGIVGKVIAAYPNASEVLLVTDPEFAAGVVSQKSGVHGTLKGQGTPTCKMDYVPLEEKIEVGETLFTSGEDRIFPRGFPAGVVKVVRNSQPFKEILVEPTGLQHGLDDVLIVVQGVHEDIPSAPPANQPVYIAPPPPAQEPKPVAQTPAADGTPAAAAPAAGTEADRLREAYKAIGEAQNHTFGVGLPGSKPPDFTKLGMPANGAPGSGRGTPPPAVNGANPTSPSAVKPGPAAPAVPPAVPKQPDSQRKANQAAGAGPGQVPER